MAEDRLYNDLNHYLRGLYGCRVQKIPIDAGFTCPNRDGTKSTQGCIYCNAYGSGTGAFRQGVSISEQIRQAKSFLGRRYGAGKFIAYFQSFSNTYAPISVLKQRYEEALFYEDIVGLAVGTRPDCISDDILALLASYQEKYLVWMEYGLQSAHDRTLEFINRGHTVADFLQAVDRTKKAGLPVCVHIILGLPGETKEDMLETARLVAGLDIQGLKIHLLYVVKGSGMESLFKRGEYIPLTQQEYVDLVCDVLELMPPDVVIQRLTGDPRPEELVAPLWARDKTGTINAVRTTLKERGSFQGKYFSLI
ncbi:MAG: TIGR01212 family radical SAM protein [Desulfovibrionales bacterium]|nr:TIGR01212 family radical SAM protein [Desulfovibrionales bacterium]